MVSSAQRGGRRLVAVTINAPNDWQDHQKLLEMGFAGYEEQTVVTEGELLGTVEITGGETGLVHLIAGKSFSYPLAVDEVVQICLPTPGFVYAPVAENQNAGYAQIYLNDVRIGSVPLVYGQTVEREKEQEPKIWQRLFGGSTNE